MSDMKMLLSPPEMTDLAIDIGVKKVNSKPWRTRILALMAGVFIAIGGIASTKAALSFSGASGGALAGAVIFSLGLISVILAGAELFTGNMLIVLAFLDKKVSLKNVLIAWSRVFIWNFIGAVLFAFLCFFAYGKEHELVKIFISTIDAKVSYSFSQAFFLAILCNILVCLGVWMSYSAKDAFGKSFVSAFPIVAFVLLKFEHIVANMFYYTIGLLAGSTVSLSTIFVNSFIPVTLGNMVGGILLGAVYYIAYKRN